MPACTFQLYRREWSVPPHKKHRRVESSRVFIEPIELARDVPVSPTLLSHPPFRGEQKDTDDDQKMSILDQIGGSATTLDTRPAPFLCRFRAPGIGLGRLPARVRRVSPRAATHTVGGSTTSHSRGTDAEGPHSATSIASAPTAGTSSVDPR